MFVDDEPRTLDSLRRLLHGRRDAWEMTFVEQPETVCEQSASDPCDVVVTDIRMPKPRRHGPSGAHPADLALEEIPVILLTGMEDRTLKRQALDLGATDLLNKPVDADDLIARLESVFRGQDADRQRRAYTQLLEQRVREQRADLQSSRLEVLWRLARAGEERDDVTGNHVVRVACYSRVIAETMHMDRNFVDRLFLAAPLHDIGKIGIPDTILLKPGPLTPSEWEVMRQHCVIGRGSCRKTPSCSSPS